MSASLRVRSQLALTLVIKLKACQPRHYREDLVGNALHILYTQHGIRREDIYLQTKFTSIAGQDKSQPLPYDPAASVRDQILASFQVSLRNLRTPYLDSYILHSPLDTLAKTVEAWRTLMELKDSGNVRSIGISNTYEVHVLETLNEMRKIEVVQNRWYEGNMWDKDVFAYCLAHGIQYQSFWTLTGSPSLLNDPTLMSLAIKVSCTPAQVVFKLAQERGIIPLAGSSNEVRMRQGVHTENLNIKVDQDSEEALKKLNAMIGAL